MQLHVNVATDRIGVRADGMRIGNELFSVGLAVYNTAIPLSLLFRL